MKCFLALGISLLVFGLSAQVNDIASVLQEVEQNNEELSALQLWMESERLTLSSSNNLPDPQFNAYYLPFGKRDAGDYLELEISQSVEFPSVYKARGEVIDARQRHLAIVYAERRQEVLLQAHQYCLEVVHLKKLLNVQEARVEQAQTVYEQAQQLFAKEQAGVLEFNKAKVAWLQEQFVVSETQNEIDNALLTLQRLNGGNVVELDQSEYSGELNLLPPESIWRAILSSDPAIQSMRQQEQVALMEYRLTKKQYLPDLAAGLNYQGMSGVYHTGIYAGLSIPLWNNRHREQAAQANHTYQQSRFAAQTHKMNSNLEKQMSAYQLQLEKYRAYQETLATLNSDALLLRAYQLGEISYIEYYTELQFYRHAFDTMLEMERALNKQKAEILKYQL